MNDEAINESLLSPCFAIAPSLNLEEAVAGNSWVDCPDVQLEQNGDTITLQGQVDTFYAKQMAQESLREIEGVGQIENNLRVV